MSSSSISRCDRETPSAFLEFCVVLVQLCNHFFDSLSLWSACPGLQQSFLSQKHGGTIQTTRGFKISICGIVGAKEISAICPWKTHMLSTAFPWLATLCSFRPLKVCCKHQLQNNIQPIQTNVCYGSTFQTMSQLPSERAKLLADFDLPQKIHIPNIDFHKPPR